MREDALRYLERLGIPQGPSRSTTPHHVGYDARSEPEPEEATLPPHVHETTTPPTWRETARSTVDTVTLKLEAYPLVRLEPTSFASNAAATAALFQPERLRLVLGRRGDLVTLISAKLTGTRVARDEGGPALLEDQPVSKGFRVTVQDLDTGETQSMVVSEGDYMLIPFAPCYLHHTQKSANGAVVLTVRDHRPRKIDQADAVPASPAGGEEK